MLYNQKDKLLKRQLLNKLDYIHIHTRQHTHTYAYILYRKDFVHIYDGNNITGAPLKTLTGSIGFGNSISSTGRDMYIHFTSDNESSSNLGFTIQYEAGK